LRVPLLGELPELLQAIAEPRAQPLGVGVGQVVAFPEVIRLGPQRRDVKGEGLLRRLHGERGLRGCGLPDPELVQDVGVAGGQVGHGEVAHE
jgi:hypothetical protein